MLGLKHVPLRCRRFYAIAQRPFPSLERPALACFGAMRTRTGRFCATMITAYYVCLLLLPVLPGVTAARELQQDFAAARAEPGGLSHRITHTCSWLLAACAVIALCMAGPTPSVAHAGGGVPAPLPAAGGCSTTDASPAAVAACINAVRTDPAAFASLLPAGCDYASLAPTVASPPRPPFAFSAQITAAAQVCARQGGLMQDDWVC